MAENRYAPSLQRALSETAEALADAARSAILPHFRTALVAENKAPDSFDPVTVADRAAETAMRDVLARMRPEDAIYGEEFGKTAGRSGLTWVLDPIDGTRAFVSGTASWGVLIALQDTTGPVLGVIDQPYIGERFFGGFGRADMVGPLGHRPLAARGGVALDEAILFTTFPELGTAGERAAFEAVRDRVKLTRYGLDCYAYALLAAGHIDLVIEAGLAPYDIAAPVGLIEAAGGVITDWRGGPAHDGGRAVAAGDAALHAAALELLNGVNYG